VAGCAFQQLLAAGLALQTTSLPRQQAVGRGRLQAEFSSLQGQICGLSCGCNQFPAESGAVFFLNIFFFKNISPHYFGHLDFIYVFIGCVIFHCMFADIAWHVWS
jgi:hypothetical protein